MVQTFVRGCKENALPGNWCLNLDYLIKGFPCLVPRRSPAVFPAWGPLVTEPQAKEPGNQGSCCCCQACSCYDWQPGSTTHRCTSCRPETHGASLRSCPWGQSNFHWNSFHASPSTTPIHFHSCHTVRAHWPVCRLQDGFYFHCYYYTRPHSL